MRTLKEWTLVVIVGILHCVSGQLHKPLNITTESRNFSLFLTWLPAPENPLNVTYIVSYKLVPEKRWKKAPNCTGTFATECDLTCVLMEHYSMQYLLRVKALSVSQKNSSWAFYLHNISYMFTVDPSPPILQIKERDGELVANISLPMPHCIKFPLRILTFTLEVKNIDNPKEIKQPIDLKEPLTTIKTKGYKGHYCMAARTKYDATKKMSGPSNTICFTFNENDQSHHLMPLFGLPVTLFVMFVGALIFIIWYKTSQRAATPTVLDFSHKRSDLPVSVVTNESPYTLTIDKYMDQTSSATLLLLKEKSDNIKEHPLTGRGYTVRKHGNFLGRDYYGHESNEYSASKSSSTNFSIDESSDSSCVQTSGSNAEMTLMLKNIQLLNPSEEINATILGNIDTLNSNTTTIGPLLETLCVSSSNSFGEVHLSTLSTAPFDQSSDNGSYDCHFTDSEENHEQLTEDYTDCEKVESYLGSQPPQKNCSSAYEQRGYMSRR